MKLKHILFASIYFSLLSFYSPPLSAQSNEPLIMTASIDTPPDPATTIHIDVSGNADVPKLQDPKPIKKSSNNKVVAAILAFPLPFGILGLHRVYLGTKPYMPIAYMATIGGCFGILPFIDFIAILASDPDSFKRFEENPKVFMWVK